MKEHLLTLFLAVTTGVTMFVFTIVNRPITIPVFGLDTVLFEHQTIHGHLVITSSAYDDFQLSFLTQGVGGQRYLGSTFASTLDETHFVSLVAGHDIPFTTHAVISTNPLLHEIIVVERGFRIAHRAHAKKTTCADTSVFVVSSFDLTGEDVLIIGLDVQGDVVVDMALP